MALKSGELAKLKVDPRVYDGVRRWLDAAQVRDSSGRVDAAQYMYNPNALPAQRAIGRTPTVATSSMGMLMRMYMGMDRNDPALIRGSEFLLEHPPELGTEASPKRNTYYWYYASQVMFHMQGDAWKNWNERLRPLLIDSQTKTGPAAGSWDPNGRVADRWGEFGGRIYVTTLNLLSLEVCASLFTDLRANRRKITRNRPKTGADGVG
ncbi:MAG: hypothetical protein QM811_27935 [Pirellulales bacterium]